MSKLKGIMAYGTEEDRQKLAVLAHFAKKSSSEWLIQQVRKQYADLFGDQPPQL